MTNVLVTGVGGDVAQGVLKVLNESFPEFQIIGCDCDPRHGAHALVDVYLSAPLAHHPNYAQWLLDTLASHDVELFIPMTEAELTVLFTGEAIRFPSGVSVISAGKQCVTIGLDKYETSQFLTDNQIAAPWILLDSKEITKSHIPCIYKPRTGSGSQGVFKCETKADVVFFEQKYPGGVFQELLTPANLEVTCAVYRTRQNETMVCQLERKLSGGATSWAKVIECAEVENQCKKIADLVDLHGSMNVQLILTKNGPRIFEINPRFSSTSLLRHRLGFPDVVWSVNEALGNRVELSSPTIGRQVARSHEAIEVEGLGNTFP